MYANQLLARFVTMDEDVLQKTNVAKLLPRFVKRGGQTVKELAQKIMDNAAASTKRKQEAAKAASKDESASKSPAPETSGDAPRTESVAGTKRPREGEKGESNGQPATKRTVTPSGAKSATKADNGAATSGKSSTETRAESKPSSATGNTAALRPKANIVAPKPTSLFGSLASASKKPGTSNAARAAAAAAAAASAKEKARYVINEINRFYHIAYTDLFLALLPKRKRLHRHRLRSLRSLLEISWRISTSRGIVSPQSQLRTGLRRPKKSVRRGFVRKSGGSCVSNGSLMIA